MVVRRKDVETCFLCGCCPCECGTKKASLARRISAVPAVPAKPDPEPTEPAVEKKRQSARDRMIAAASAATDPSLPVVELVPQTRAVPADKIAEIKAQADF